MRLLSLSALLAVSCVVGLGCNNNHLEAGAKPTATQPIEDQFTQTSSNGKSDILFIINNTDDTMVAKATTLGSSATAFMNYLTTNQIDFHIAVTSMDMVTSDSSCSLAIGSAGCFGGSPHVIDSSTPNLLATFQANLQVGFGGDATELGIDAGLAAVTAPLATTGANAGFLRSDAKLFVVYITDEDDNATVPGGNIFSAFNPGDYIAAYAAAKGGNTTKVVFSAIAGDVPNGCGGGSSNGVGGDPGTEYAALIQASNGLFESVCDAEYSTFLSNLGYTLATPQATFPLSQVPSDPSTIQVTVNGQPVPSSDWTYDASTNSITFTPGNIPPASATIVIDYDVST